MCGNGIRCVAKFVHDHDICRREQLTIETGGGLRQLQLQTKDGKAELITVDMGPASNRSRQSANHAQSYTSRRLAVTFAGQELKVTCVLDGKFRIA